MQQPKISQWRVLIAACLCSVAAMIWLAVATFGRASAYATGYPDLASATSAKVYAEWYGECVDDLSDEDFDEFKGIIARLNPHGSRVAVTDLTPTEGCAPAMFLLTLPGGYEVRVGADSYESRIIVGSGSWKADCEALADLQELHTRCYDRYWLPIADELGLG